MKKTNWLNIVLELIVIFGHLIVGVTVVTFVLQKETISRPFIGLVLMAMGMIDLTEFFTLKIESRLKSIQNVVVALLTIALGTVLLFVKIDYKTMCIILGSCCICFGVTRITTAILNLLRQPLINGIRLILNVTMIVVCIFLIVKTLDFIVGFTGFMGVLLLVEAAFLLIEFIIHRYQS